MKHIKSILLIAVICLFCKVACMQACTSFIVSGKSTPDGRPLLFKNRDTGEFNTLSVYFKGDKYDFIADVNANSKDEGVWYGHNSAGFAIINTAAYNLNPKEKDNNAMSNDKNKFVEKDGYVMKMALGKCSTLKDFEQMIDTMAKPLRCNSNFGIIDAHGGCAYYEVNNNGYVKFDVNDPKIAPYGYLVRTNHGMSGDRNIDKGLCRYMAISDICLNLYNENGFSIENALKVPHYLTHGLTNLNLYDYIPDNDSQPCFMAFRDFIPRCATATAVLIQGVKSGESPLLTVSWTIVGSPLTTIAVPLCITPSGKLPSLVTKGSNGKSTLCSWGLSLKKELFPIERGEGCDYIDLSKLINKQGTGILQKNAIIEKEVVNKGEKVLEVARKNGKFDKSIDDYYAWFDAYVTNAYQTQYPEIFNK
jgi:hypothetical protein